MVAIFPVKLKRSDEKNIFVLQSFITIGLRDERIPSGARRMRAQRVSAVST
jgi:hypothetical protein